MVVERNGKDIKQIKCNGLECGWGSIVVVILHMNSMEVHVHVFNC